MALKQFFSHKMAQFGKTLGRPTSIRNSDNYDAPALEAIIRESENIIDIICRRDHERTAQSCADILAKVQSLKVRVLKVMISIPLNRTRQALQVLHDSIVWRETELKQQLNNWNDYV